MTLNIPTGLLEGYHTIHVYGYSYAHEPLDIYETVTYGETRSSTDDVLTTHSLSKNSFVENVSSQNVLGLSYDDQSGAKYLNLNLKEVNNLHPSLDIWICVGILGGSLAGIGIALFVLRRRYHVHKNSSQDPGG